MNMAENVEKIDRKSIENNKIENYKEEKKKSNKNKKKTLTINGISIWRILAYFIIYSVAGYIIETVYGMITKGVWESRQSFLYGPFCGIYGLGAVVMIIQVRLPAPRRLYSQ